MQHLIVKAIFLSFCVWFVYGKKFPSHIQRCKRDDPGLDDCMKSAITDMKQYSGTGIKELNIPPMDPYVMESASLITSWVNASFTDMKFYNAHDFEIDAFKLDLDKGTILMNLTTKYLEAKGNYVLDGHLLQFALHGEGVVSGNFTETKFFTEMHGKKIVKKGKEYLNLENINLKFDRNSLDYLYFDGLFKQNPALQERFHVLLQDAKDDLAVDVMPIAEKAISSIILLFFKAVFDAYPLDVLFI